MTAEVWIVSMYDSRHGERTMTVCSTKAAAQGIGLQYAVRKALIMQGEKDSGPGQIRGVIDMLKNPTSDCHYTWGTTSFYIKQYGVLDA